MPDTKLSWPMLKEHLRKYIWIYLVGIALCLAGTDLLWTTTRPQPRGEETVVIYLVGDYGDPEALQGIADDMCARAGEEDPRLKQVSFEWLRYNDEEVDYTGSMLLMTRLATGDGDAYIASGAGLAALARAAVLLPPDDPAAEGWSSATGLEPCYVEIAEEEGAEPLPVQVGLKLDGVDGLMRLGAFDNRGAALCLSAASANPETTRRALEIMLEDLTDAGTENP